jgi:2-polyprenyl-6-hydroxyphenyl methylase/3-demethylubiquinone-9 3-methyltransferase
MAVFLVPNWRSLVKDFLRGKPFKSIRDYGKNQRGMSFWQDLVDWVGGYPFEVATRERYSTSTASAAFYSRACKPAEAAWAATSLCFRKCSDGHSATVNWSCGNS